MSIINCQLSIINWEGGRGSAWEAGLTSGTERMGEMKDRRVAVIGGGNMGGALVAGMIRTGLVLPDCMTVVDALEAPLERLRADFGVKTSRRIQGVVGAQDVVLVAVKPQIWPSIAGEIAGEVGPDQLLISIMAGMRTSAIEDALSGEVPVIRAMPNILAQVGAAVSALCPGRYATEAHLQIARDILGAVGETVVVAEWQMDGVTGLSGSGPAYVFSMIDALADGGVKVGLSKEIALKLAAQTVFGAAKAVLESGDHPAVLKDRVTSPGGTTIAGLYAMEQAGFRAALMAAVEAATRRSEELGG